MKKAGRKRQHHTDSATGLPVVGLSKMSDGRWRVIGTHTRFTEPDEQRAIRRFYDLTDQRVQGTVAGIAVDARRSELLDLKDQLERIIKTNDREFWRRVADEIRESPKRIAKLTGIEEIGYLRDLEPPEDLPSLKELEDLWERHAGVGPVERRKVLGFWRDFTAATKVRGLEEIRPKLVIAYRDEVYRRGLRGKSQANLFNGIRSLLSFARRRAVAVDAVGKALDALRLLTPSESTVNLDPRPVSKEDFRKLLDHAWGDDRAMILLALNMAAYLQEVVRLRWDEVRDGCVVTRRNKTGKCIRVAVLWKETLEALAAVKRRGEFVFYANTGLPLSISGAEKRFVKLRDAAGLAVTSSQLRDGAYTAAVRANVTEGIVKLLVGHRGSGLSDHYVARSPEMVKPACDAVYTAYFSHDLSPGV